MTIEQLPNRRRVLATLAGVGMAGVAGCFGSDDDEGEDSDDSTDDSTDDSDEQTDPTADLTDEEIAEEVSGDFVNVLEAGDVDQYNQFLHSDGELEPIDSEEETFFGPDISILERTVTAREDEQIIVETTVEVKQLDETFETTWELDIRREGDTEWGLWDIVTDELLSEPALSPEAVVDEFVQALAEGNTDTATGLLAEDGSVPETIQSEPEEFQGIIELEETSVQDREDGRARIDATVVYEVPDSDDDVIDTWELTVAVVEGDWAIGWVR